MNLYEYFKNQNYKMPEQDKLVVFDDIKTKISQESIFTRVSFYSKVWIYTVFLLFVFFWLFYYDSDLSKWLVQQNQANLVNADYIWKVLKFNWNYKVYYKGNIVNTNILKKWSVLVLSNDTNISLWINKWIKLHLLWPAKIQFNSYINQDWLCIYIINMLDWNYLSVKSNSNKDKIIIKSNYFNIESNDNLVDLKYTKKGGASLIENNWWNILVKKKNNIVPLWNNEQLVILWKDSINYIKNIFSSKYKQYQIDNNWKLKTVITAEQVKKLWYLLNRNNVIMSVWKYVLWKLNNDNRWLRFGKTQTIQTILNVYNFFGFKLPDLVKWQIQNPLSLSLSDEELLVDNLIHKINDNYIIPKEYIVRLKVILAYLVILDKMKINKNLKFDNLSSLVNYLKLDVHYKKILLTF